jgi:hypothetical protein
MILETTQLLSNAHWTSGSEGPYRLTHKNHPCSIWVRNSLANYLWLVDLGLALSHEYTYRYEKVHKCEIKLNWLKENKPKLSNLGLTKPALAMPDEFKHFDPIIAYRTLYDIGKRHLHKWKKREVPLWIT